MRKLLGAFAIIVALASPVYAQCISEARVMEKSIGYLEGEAYKSFMGEYYINQYHLSDNKIVRAHVMIGDGSVLIAQVNEAGQVCRVFSFHPMFYDNFISEYGSLMVPVK